MVSARERWLQFVESGDAYALAAVNLIAAGLAVSSKQSGPGGGNFSNVFQYDPTSENPDPNTKVYVPNTEPAICLNASDISNTIIAALWKKTDGIISNTGWVAVPLMGPPIP